MENHQELTGAPGGGLRILAVEDHPAVRDALRAFLDCIGHKSIFATDVRSALRLAKERDFDLLLSDICLPDGDGWELLRRLKEAGRCPPQCIAMSCLTGAADIARSMAAGFAAHLHKPFSPDELEAALVSSASKAAGAL